jgi:hypothetical protein
VLVDVLGSDGLRNLLTGGESNGVDGTISGGQRSDADGLVQLISWGDGESAGDVGGGLYLGVLLEGLLTSHLGGSRFGGDGVDDGSGRTGNLLGGQKVVDVTLVVRLFGGRLVDNPVVVNNEL